jgi:hypothetical protein
MRSTSVGILALASGTLVAAAARAQQTAAPVWTGSARAATIQFTDTTSLNALGGVLEYRLASWLRFGVAPTLVRAKSGSTTTSGLGDLPLALEASSKWGAPLQLGAGLVVTLPTGSAACGLGAGVTSVGMELGAGVTPTAAVHLSANASRSFSGAVTLSSLDQPQSTWLDIDGDIDFAPRLSLSVSAGGDVGGTDSVGVPAERAVGSGVSYALSGALALTVDVTHGVAGPAPRWGVSLSLGTASSGISALNSVSPLGRQRQVFVSGGQIGGGHGRFGRGGGGGTTVTTTNGCP